MQRSGTPEGQQVANSLPDPPVVAPRSAVPGAAPAPRTYLPELDSLRFLAFTLVFLHHALPQHPEAYTRLGFGAEAARWFAAVVDSGGFGVDLFFALSSYLITTLLVRERDRYGSLDVRAFYVRRALRIWPLYYAFIAFAVLIAPRLIPTEHLPTGHLLGYLLMAGNWTTAAFGYPSSVAAPLWSISVEEQFYLVWPLVIGLAGLGRLRQVAFGMLAVSTLVRVGLIGMGVEHPGIWANTFARLDPIALGALVATAPRPATFTAGRSLAAIVVGLLLWVGSSRFLALDGYASLLLYPLVAIGSVLLLTAVLRSSGAVRAALAREPLIFLGRISYGLYVFHLFGIQLVNQLPLPQGAASTVALRIVLSFATTVLLSVASYYAIERPFLRWKTRFARVASRPE